MPDRADSRNGRSVRRNNRTDEVDGQFIPSTENGQRALLSAGFAAGDGGIHKRHVLFRTLLRDLTRQHSTGCRVIDQDTARRHSRQHTVLPVHNRANIFVIAYAQKNELCPKFRVSRRVSRFALELFFPSLCFRFRAVEHAHFVPCLLEMARHGISHGSQPNKGNRSRNGRWIRFFQHTFSAPDENRTK